MAGNIFNNRQSKQISSLPFITGAAGSTNDVVISAIDSELSKLFEDRNVLLTQGGIITYAGTNVTFSESLKLEINSKVAGGSPVVIDLGSTARNISASGRMIYAVIDRLVGTATITDDATTLPAVTNANQEVFLIAKRQDAADGTKRLYWRNGTAMNEGQTIRLGASGSGGGTGTGDDINTLRFKASFSDTFDESPTANTSAVQSSITNATYSAANGLYRMSYDATQTGSSTGTTFTLSGAPAFTVAAGDVVVNQSTGEVCKIASISSQTSYTLESGFSSNLSSAAVTVSQAVHSVDLRAYTANNTGLALNAIFPTDTVSNFMLWYKDSVSSGDIVWDMPASAVVSFVASADNSSWTTKQSRQSDLSASMPVRAMATSGSNFYVRFFSSATSGSGAVNILDYKAYMHQDNASSGGAAYNTAFALTSGAGSAYNCSVSSATGKTRITTSWAFATGLNSGSSQGQIEVYLNGQKIPRFIDTTLTPDAYFVEVSANTVELDQDYSGAGLSVEIRQPVPVIDSTNVNSSSIQNIQEMSQKGFQGFVDESSVLTAVNGAPGTGQFRSSITNRASITDISNDLKVRMGVERIPVQQTYQLQNEFGPNGEPVWAALNDDRGLMRFVGAWTNAVDSDGESVTTINTTDFVEITFYGTGLNLLCRASTASLDMRATIDGGAEGSNIFAGVTFSNVLAARNYSANQVVSVALGLTQGLHTIKIRNNQSSQTQKIYGFEILNESANVNVRPGAAFVNGKKLVSSTASSVAYNSGTFDSVLQNGVSTSFSTARGGRVLSYIKSDGTIGKSAVLTNSAAAYLGSADHANEEVARTYQPREFGAGRSDDFSTLSTSSSSRAFTLDDGTTTLVGTNITLSAWNNSMEAIATEGGGVISAITFVGTGLDVVFSNGTITGTMTIAVDGSTVSSTYAPTANKIYTQKIVSGLPYGTHVVSFSNSALGGSAHSLGIAKFITYQPKKPSLPSGAIELADYNVMANFAATTDAVNNDAVSTGTLKKYNVREMIYSGASWGIVQNASYNETSNGFRLQTNTVNDYVQYTFYGTGFDFKFPCYNNNTTSATMSIDGSTNLSSYTTSFYGCTSFTAATGVINQYHASNTAAGVTVSGLPLGIHTVKVTCTVGNASAYLRVASFDIITPIHSPKPNLFADLQNTLPVGSQALSDNRRTSPVKSEDPKKFRAFAVGVTSTPSITTTSFYPLQDLSVVVLSRGGWFEVAYSANVQSSSGFLVHTQLYVNGLPENGTEYRMSNVYEQGLACSKAIYLPAGTHKIDVYWKVSGGTGYSNGILRNLKVTEV